MIGIGKTAGNIDSKRSLVLAAIAPLLIYASLEVARKSWRVGEDNLLTNLDFSNGLAGWKVEGDVRIEEGGILHLRASDLSRFTGILKEWPAATNYSELMVRAEIATTQVVRGKDSWQMARVILAPYTGPDTQLHHQPATVVELDGDNDWQVRTTIFQMDATADRYFLGVQLPYAAGEVRVRGLEFRAAERKGSFLPLAIVVCVLWVGWSLVLMGTLPLTRSLGVLPKVLLGGLLVLGMLLLPGVNKASRPPLGIPFQFERADFGAPITANPKSKPTRSAPPLIDWSSATAHTLAFGALTLLGCWITGRRRFAAVAAILAIGSEVSQTIRKGTAHREDLSDLFHNLLGVVLALAVFAYWRLRRAQKLA